MTTLDEQRKRTHEAVDWLMECCYNEEIGDADKQAHAAIDDIGETPDQTDVEVNEVTENIKRLVSMFFAAGQRYEATGINDPDWREVMDHVNIVDHDLFAAIDRLASLSLRPASPEEALQEEVEECARVLRDIWYNVASPTSFDDWLAVASRVLADKKAAMEKVTGVIVCSWCGRVDEKKATELETQEMLLDHATTCEKRPEKALLDKMLALEADRAARIKAVEEAAKRAKLESGGLRHMVGNTNVAVLDHWIDAIVQAAKGEK